MKKAIYISSIVSLNFITIGSLFKLMHWPGANILLIVGILAFGLVILPLAIYKSYQTEGKSPLVYLVGYICTVMVLISALFKILHLPGAGILLIIALPLPIVLFLPIFYLYQKKHHIKNPAKLIGVMLILLYYVVFSALLSLNANRNVLQNFIVNVELLENTKNTISKINEQKYKEINIQNATIKQLKTKTDSLINEITNISNNLIARSENINSDKVDTLPLVSLNSLDNYDITTFIMIGRKDANLHNSLAFQLKNKLIDYKNFISALISKDTLSAVRVIPLLDITNKKTNSNNFSESWEIHHFYHSILVAVIFKLKTIEFEIKMLEYEVLKTMQK